MEIPTLPEKERQKMFTQIWVGQMYGVIGFIIEKLGPQGGIQRARSKTICRAV
jgi:hypothetical protein